ncbi:molybdopterin-guanine dinucleotide biosynthesis adapter protein [Candidatus Magnetomoraceae bacterium gMMP-15]
MPPVISIVGKSNSGKTTLLSKLIPVLKKRGYRIGVIKHSSHNIIIDHKGKDSWIHKQAGADGVAVYSDKNIALFKDINPIQTLDHIVENYFKDMELIFTEGFKREDKPKIEVFRIETHKEPLCLNNDNNLIAFVSETNFDSNVPHFGLDDVETLANFIEQKFFNNFHLSNY